MNSIDEELNRILKEEEGEKNRNFQKEMSLTKKSWTTALILSITLGYFGIDRFYLGYPGMGALKMCTFGGCLILWFSDIYSILTKSLKPHNGEYVG